MYRPILLLLLIVLTYAFSTNDLSADVLIEVTVNVSEGSVIDKPNFNQAKAHLIGAACGVHIKSWKKKKKYPKTIKASATMEPELADKMFMYLCIKFVRAGKWWTEKLDPSARFVYWCIKRGAIVPPFGKNAFDDGEADRRYVDMIKKHGLGGAGRVKDEKEHKMEKWTATVVPLNALGPLTTKDGKADPGGVVHFASFTGLFSTAIIKESIRERLKLEHEFGHMLDLRDGIGGIMIDVGGNLQAKFPNSVGGGIKPQLDKIFGKAIYVEGTPPKCECCPVREVPGTPGREVPGTPGREEEGARRPDRKERRESKIRPSGKKAY